MSLPNDLQTVANAKRLNHITFASVLEKLPSFVQISHIMKILLGFSGITQRRRVQKYRFSDGLLSLPISVKKKINSSAERV